MSRSLPLRPQDSTGSATDGVDATHDERDGDARGHEDDDAGGDADAAPLVVLEVAGEDLLKLQTINKLSIEK